MSWRATRLWGSWTWWLWQWRTATLLFTPLFISYELCQVINAKWCILTYYYLTLMTYQPNYSIKSQSLITDSMPMISWHNYIIFAEDIFQTVSHIVWFVWVLRACLTETSYLIESVSRHHNQNSNRDVEFLFVRVEWACIVTDSMLS